MTDLAAELVEEIIDKKFETVNQIDVGMVTSDARENNSGRRLITVRIVVML